MTARLAVWYGSIVVAGFVAGYVTHRPPPPAQAEAKEVTKYVDRVVYQDRTVTVAGKDRIIHRVVKVAVAPDGSQTKVITTDSDTRATATTSSETKAAAEHVVYQDREVRVTNDVRPTWNIGALGGVDLDRRVWWGGMVTHRLFGPIDVGIVVVRAGDWNAGVTVGLQW